MLQCGGERELDALALFVASVRPEQAALEPEPLVGVGLEPDRFGDRFGGAVVGVGRRRVVNRQHPLRPPLDRLQAGVGGDLVEPGTKRAAPLEPCQPAPGAQQRLLQGVLRVRDRAEHAVAVRVKLGAVGPDEPAVGILVTLTGGVEQLGLPQLAP